KYSVLLIYVLITEKNSLCVTDRESSPGGRKEKEISYTQSSVLRCGIPALGKRGERATHSASHYTPILISISPLLWAAAAEALPQAPLAAAASDFNTPIGLYTRAHVKASPEILPTIYVGYFLCSQISFFFLSTSSISSIREFSIFSRREVSRGNILVDSLDMSILV
ncbi:hypothetical protein TSAR_010485, partial [Trichomalopsis sarcophagae]